MSEPLKDDGATKAPAVPTGPPNCFVRGFDKDGVEEVREYGQHKHFEWIWENGVFTTRKRCTTCGAVIETEPKR